MKYKAALIDMNGVITDDEPLHEAAFVKALGDSGYQLSHEGYEKHFAGKTDKAGFDSFFVDRDIEASEIESLGEEKAAAYKELAKKSLKSYPGIVEYLRTLRGRGVVLALVTSSIRTEADTALEVFNIDDLFEIVVTADDIKTSKPHPEGYLMAVNALGVSKEECFVLEDSPSGVAAANAAGIDCVAITNTHSAKDLSAATEIVDSLPLTHSKR